MVKRKRVQRDRQGWCWRLGRQPGIWWCCPLAEQSAHGASIFTATFIWKSICPWLNYLLVRLLLNPLSSVGVNSGICICLRNSICVLFLVYPYNSKKMPTVNLRCISICFLFQFVFLMELVFISVSFCIIQIIRSGWAPHCNSDVYHWLDEKTQLPRITYAAALTIHLGCCTVYYTHYTHLYDVHYSLLKAVNTAA